ncbi:DUF6882 domain-containing protein [Microbacterium sp. YY-01]|uniref:DUF6882 domain-containing protein n=1 Tax=Microbacterium sp. YY-01 TaxID=3421634 RepID=UPI003D180987
MTFDALRPLADRACLFTALRQEQLRAATDALGPHRWDVDMQARTLTFTAENNPQHRLVAAAHLIASIAPGPRSLLWGWAHPSGGPDSVAAGLRDYGASYSVEALTTQEVAFPADISDDQLEAWIADAAHVVGGVASEITGRSPYYSAPAGGGTRAVFVLDGIVHPLTVADAVTLLPRVLGQTTPSDPRTSVWDLARLASWQMQWADEQYSGATVSDHSGSATIRFDEHARISGIDSNLGGAAAQY